VRRALPEHYEPYRLMRLFPGLSYEDVMGLPAGFAMWAFQFDRVEREIESDQMKAASGG